MPNSISVYFVENIAPILNVQNIHEVFLFTPPCDSSTPAGRMVIHKGVENQWPQALLARKKTWDHARTWNGWRPSKIAGQLTFNCYIQLMQRTAIITGSTNGIGLAIARRFACLGYSVAFNGLETNGAAIAAAVAGEHHIDHQYSDANMLDHAALCSWVNSILSRWGRIDVLVNNAGIQHVASLEDFPAEKWEELIRVNLTAPFHLIQAVWPAMREQRFGRIINIASAHGIVASPFKSAYVSSKHGLIGLTKTAALEGAPYGITCNAVCPGYVNTDLVAKQIKDLSKQRGLPENRIANDLFLQKHAINEFVSAENIAALCAFLASDESASITGTTLPIDGGWTAQ
jgi:3-hydroxybutyrate dehydrogenase